MSALQELLLTHARALSRQGRVPEALAAYAELLSDRSGAGPSADPRVLFELATLQRRAGLASLALESYRRAIAGGLPNPEEAYLHRALVFSDLERDPTAAERELRAALECNPRYVPALHNLGNLYEDLGRREDARTAYARILALDETWFEALGRAALLLPRSEPEHETVARLRAALEDPRASALDRAGLGFALGTVLDGRGRYAEAFAAYAEANAASRAAGLRAAGAAPGARAYDRPGQEDLVSRLIRTPLPPGLPSLDATALRSSGIDLPLRAPRPIFICGMFRSGSTLTEHLLASHPAVGAGGELAFFPQLAANDFVPFPESLPRMPRARLEAARQAYLARLEQIFPGKSWVIDKRPDNFLYLGLIKTLFPEARIIHTVRAPLDNCLSIFFLHLDSSMSYATDLLDIGHYYRQYRRLMSHWRARFGPDIYDFDYDRFVRNPAQCAKQLYEWLGLEWQDRFLERPGLGTVVRTASVWQVRQPIYTESSGRASHYQAELAPLASDLADLLAMPSRISD